MQIFLEAKAPGWEIPKTKLDVYGVVNDKGELKGSPFAFENKQSAILYPPDWKSLFRVQPSEEEYSYTKWDQEFDIRDYRNGKEYPPVAGTLFLASNHSLLCLLYSQILNTKGTPSYFETNRETVEVDEEEMRLRRLIERPRFEWTPTNNRIWIEHGKAPLTVGIRFPEPTETPWHMLSIDNSGEIQQEIYTKK